MSDNQEIYPKDWPLRRLEDIAFHITSGGTPTSGNARFYSESGQYLFAKTEDLTASKTKYLEHCELKITESALRESSAKIYPVGTILISMYGTIGLTKITRCELAANQALCALMPPFNCDPNYLYQHLEFIRPDWLRFSGQTTQANISGGIVRVREVPLPAISEQKQIAQILDTIDTAIQQTQAIINKLKQLKQGLLHDLLTRGVDAKGELRPCYEDAPHLYKESPLGWIPKEWEVTQVGNEVSIEHGFAFAGGLFTNEPIGPVLLVPGNFHRDGELYFTPHNTKYFTGKYPKETVLSRGDLLVVMTDLSPMTLILGRTAILQEKHLVLHNQRIGKYIFKSKKDWSTSFFSSFMNDDRVRTRIIAEATGTTVRHTSPERIKDCYIAKPSLDEQKKIDSHLLAIHTRLDLEKNNLLKLIQQKTALMDDLLTGRIRVTSLLQTEASSV
jgi:type I restriction enzyme S subunit